MELSAFNALTAQKPTSNDRPRSVNRQEQAVRDQHKNTYGQNLNNLGHNLRHNQVNPVNGGNSARSTNSRGRPGSGASVGGGSRNRQTVNINGGGNRPASGASVGGGSRRSVNVRPGDRNGRTGRK